MKKLLAILCTAMLLMTCCIPVLAADEGSITITKAIAGQTYSIYQMATVEYNTEKPAYEYVATSDWDAFFASEDAQTYFNYDADTKIVTAKDGADENGAAIAELAIAYAADLTATESKTATADTVEFTGLSLGYYLIDSTVGTLCILNTTDPNFTKDEKNAEPKVEKVVEEDSDNSWGEENDADLGQTVNFKTTITAQAGAANYVLHDTMNGLTLDENSIVVTNGSNTLTAGTDYTVAYDTADGCDFEITFEQTFCDTLEADETIVVTYSATVNTDAVIAGEGNSNTTKLSYGEDANTKMETTEDKTVTYVYEFDVVKTSDANQTGTYDVLDGATFKLYTAKTGGEEIKLVKVSDGVYRVAVTDDDKADDVTVSTSNGAAKIYGLDSDTYYLEEVEAPTGYNKLTERKEVVIDAANLNVAEGALDDLVYDASTDGGVHIINKTGTVLPSTGGIGTTMFILVGGGLALCAGILLVTKKRMAKIAD